MIASCWQKLKSTILPIQDEKKCQHKTLEMRLGFAAGHLCTWSMQIHVWRECVCVCMCACMCTHIHTCIYLSLNLVCRLISDNTSWALTWEFDQSKKLHSEEAVFSYHLDGILNSERREDGCWHAAGMGWSWKYWCDSEDNFAFVNLNSLEKHRWFEI